MSYNRYSYGTPSVFNPFNMQNAVNVLIAANASVFIVQQFLGYKIISIFGLVPAYVVQKLWLWQIVTYMFLHGSIWHFLINMFMLWMIGRSIENTWGTKEFVKYYFLTGIGAGILNILFSPFSVIPSIGASGALYGLLVAYAMLYPKAVIYVYFLFPMRASHMVIVFAIIEFISSWSHNTGVANIAHLGGMLTGFLYLRYWFWIKLRVKSFANNTGRHNSRRNNSTDNIAQKADAILEKILIKGPSSLTPEERKTMDEYSRMKRL